MTSFNTPGFIEPVVVTDKKNGESPTIRRKRLRFRSRYRGIREADILLGYFADHYLDQLSPAEVDCYESLLREPDSQILAWITGDAVVPTAHQNSVMDKLKNLDYRGLVGR